MKISRILKLSDFRTLTTNKTSWFAHPSTWDDKVEDYIMGATILSQGWTGKINRDGVYAQSWSKTIESNLMWAGYSLDKNGNKITDTVKIVVELNDYANFIITNLPDFAQTKADPKFTFKHGEVEYVEFCNFVTEFQNILKKFPLLPGTPLSTNPLCWLSTLFIKRHEFKDENEYRFTFVCDSKSSGINLPNMPLEIIKEITYHPDIDQSLFEDELTRLSGIAQIKAKITKSTLSDKNNLIINL